MNTSCVVLCYKTNSILSQSMFDNITQVSTHFTYNTTTKSVVSLSTRSAYSPPRKRRSPETFLATVSSILEPSCYSAGCKANRAAYIYGTYISTRRSTRSGNGPRRSG